MTVVPARFAYLIVILLTLCGVITPALAGPTPPAASDQTQGVTVSTDQLKKTVAALQDPAQRDALVQQMQALIAAQQADTGDAAEMDAANSETLGDTVVAFISTQVDHLTRALAAAAAEFSPANVSAWGHSFTDPQKRVLWLEGSASVIIALGLAWLAERLADALFSIPRRRLHAAEGPFWGRLLGTIGIILLRVVPLAAFLATGYAVLAFAMAWFGPQPIARTAALAILEAYALIRGANIFLRALLTPPQDGRHLFHIDEETANYWYVWLSRLILFTICSHYALGFALAVGMGIATQAIVAKLLGLIFVGLLVMLLLQNRASVAAAIRGQTHGGPALHSVRIRFAEIWHIMAIVYVLGGYSIWAAEITGGFSFLIRASLLTALVLLIARFAAIGGTRLAHRLLRIRPELTERFPGLQRRANLYAPILISIGCAVVYLLAALMVMQIWGIDAVVWVSSEAGRHLVGGLLVIAGTAAIATATWEVVGIVIELYLSRPDANGMPVTHSARTRTLLPLFRKTLAILLSIVVALVVLAEVGIDVGPLLAGAGIAGIAIGFGAQTLVKDVITGLFILMQDAVSVGDVVTVAGCSGLVEQISIRSMRLRDLSGTVIIIPFSEVSTVKNMTKEFAYAVFDIGIGYREDVDEVIEVIKGVAEELAADQEHAWRILEPIEILGLDQFADSAVIVKARIKTRPIEQWTIMREFNRRLKRRFDELDIEIPFPHQTIYFGADKSGKAPAAHLEIDRYKMMRRDSINDDAARRIRRASL
jgi:small conductance mechanosensitive channel